MSRREALSTRRYWRQRRAERRLLAALVLVPLAVVGLAFLMVLPGCYATTGPVPTCAQNPWQPQCPQPIYDRRAPDGGR